MGEDGRTTAQEREKTMKHRGVIEKAVGSGVWWIQYFDQHGKRHREKVGPMRLAIAAYQKRKTEIREGRFFPEKLKRRDVSFAEIAKDALEYSRANKGPDSHKADRWHMDTLLEWFGDRLAAEVTPQEIDRKLSGLWEEGRKPATLNRYRALLSLAYSVANRNGKLSVNPARLVRLRKENNARVRFLDDQEESVLRSRIRALYPEREPDFDLDLHTGMRRSEQYRLRWQDVDLKRGIITIPRSKPGEKRHIPINSTARAALGMLRSRADSSGLVCPELRWVDGNDARRWFEECVKQAGVVNFHWHDLRHTFASRLVMAGVDLRTVQELLGHKTIAMTVRYSHLAPAHQREAIERLASRPTATATATEAILENAVTAA